MAGSRGRFAFPAEDTPLFDLYDRLNALTDGAVDPLVGRDLERHGYDRSYSLRPRPGSPEEGRPCWPLDVRREGATLLTERPVVPTSAPPGRDGWSIASQHFSRERVSAPS